MKTQQTIPLFFLLLIVTGISSSFLFFFFFFTVIILLSLIPFFSTGDTFELSYTHNTGRVTYISPISVGSSINYYCKNYTIKNPIKTNDRIFIYLKKYDIDPLIYDLQISDNSTSVNITRYFLQDSEYNSNHWMSTIDLSYIQQII